MAFSNLTSRFQLNSESDDDEEFLRQDGEVGVEEGSLQSSCYFQPEESFKTAQVTLSPRFAAEQESMDSFADDETVSLQKKRSNTKQRRKMKQQQQEIENDKSEMGIIGKSDELLETQKVAADALANAGTMLARKNDLPGAIRLFTEAIRLNPQFAGYYSNRSLCFFKLGDYSKSLTDANLALEFEPTSLKFLYRKGSALLRLQKYSDAREVAKSMLAIDPQSKQAVEILNSIPKPKETTTARAQKATGSKQPSGGSLDDAEVGVVISNLPNTVDAETVRDLICSRKISINHPVLFIINKDENAGRDEGNTTSAVIYLTDGESRQQVIKYFNNFPYGLKCLQVQLLKQSVYKELKLSTYPNNTHRRSSASDSDSSPESEIISSNGNSINGNFLVNQEHAAADKLSVRSSSPASGSISVRHQTDTPLQPFKKSTLAIDMMKKANHEIKSIFIGNIPLDCEDSELKELILQHAPEILPDSYTVVKKAKWDFAFGNFSSPLDAESARDALDKVRFKNVILEVKLHDSSTATIKPKQPKLPKSNNTEEKPTFPVITPSPTTTNVYVSNFNDAISLHEMFTKIYPEVYAATGGSDFTVYRQTSWPHCFLNFPNAEAAVKAVGVLNGMKLKSDSLPAPITLVANLAASKGKTKAPSEWAKLYTFSLDKPSSVIRVDNVDGIVSDSEIKLSFPGHNAFIRDYPFAYFIFSSSVPAEEALRVNQGRPLRNTNLVIRFANRK